MDIRAVQYNLKVGHVREKTVRISLHITMLLLQKNVCTVP
jgi:hypothetical protein